MPSASIDFAQDDDVDPGLFHVRRLQRGEEIRVVRDPGHQRFTCVTGRQRVRHHHHVAKVVGLGRADHARRIPSLADRFRPSSSMRRALTIATSDEKDARPPAREFSPGFA
jgi:hypothetical protein